MANRERQAYLASGGGSTFFELAKAEISGELKVDPAVLIASESGIGAIEKAHRLRIPVEIVNPNDFRGDDKKIDQDGFGEAILRVLRRHRATLVTQNGWMPLTPENVIEAYEGHIFNQHPGPIPEFGGKGMYGRRVHAAVLMFRRLTKGPMWTEVIGQRVSPEFDGGVVLESSRVPILKSDTVDELAQRALPVEHATQIRLVEDYVKGNLIEVQRETILVPGQEAILAQAKKIAQLLYPHG